MSDSPDADDLNATTDHALVRKLIDEEGGYPAHVEGSESEGDQGLLRIGSRTDNPDDSLKEISWDEFFEEFERKGLMLTYTDVADEGDARVLNLVERDEAM